MKLLFRNFSLVHRLDRWLRGRFTAVGLLVLGGLVVAAVFGADTRRSNGYQVFALLAVLVVVALLAAMPFRGRFRVRRDLPEFATVGAPLDYNVTVESLGGRALAGLILRDHLEERLPTFEEFRATRAPGEDRRNWLDRQTGYPRWQWLLRRGRGGSPEETALPTIAPRARVQVKVRFMPLRRGVIHFSHAEIVRADPLGIAQRALRVDIPQTLLVLPRRYPLPDLELPGARRYQHGGVSMASRVGDAEEFVGLRDYRPGDPLKRIHWASWARAGKPIVKEFQDEFFVRHALVLDTFAAPGDTERLETAISVAASFAAAVRTQDSLLDLMFVGAQAYTFTAGRGLAGPDGMLRILAAVGACTEHPFSELAQSVTRHATALSGCICVLLGWDEERQALVKRLRALGTPVLVLVVGPVASPDPGPMASDPARFHVLDPARVGEGLAALA